MLWLLAILVPPVAVLMCGKPWQALLNLFLWAFLFMIPGIIHALLVVNEFKADKRQERMTRAMRNRIE